MELKGKQHKTIKRKASPVARVLKAHVRELWNDLQTVETQLAHENKRWKLYANSLPLELNAGLYEEAKHTTRCKKAAAKRIDKWESVRATLLLQYRTNAKFLSELRAAEGRVRKDPTDGHSRFIVSIITKKFEKLL